GTVQEDMIADQDPRLIRVLVMGEQHAPACDCALVSDHNLAASPNADALNPVIPSDLHAQETIKEDPQAADGTDRDPEEPRFQAAQVHQAGGPFLCFRMAGIASSLPRTLPSNPPDCRAEAITENASKTARAKTSRSPRLPSTSHMTWCRFTSSMHESSRGSFLWSPG